MTWLWSCVLSIFLVSITAHAAVPTRPAFFYVGGNHNVFMVEKGPQGYYMKPFSKHHLHRIDFTSRHPHGYEALKELVGKHLHDAGKLNGLQVCDIFQDVNSDEYVFARDPQNGKVRLLGVIFGKTSFVAINNLRSQYGPVDNVARYFTNPQVPGVVLVGADSVITTVSVRADILNVEAISTPIMEGVSFQTADFTSGAPGIGLAPIITTYLYSNEGAKVFANRINFFANGKFYLEEITPHEGFKPTADSILFHSSDRNAEALLKKILEAADAVSAPTCLDDVTDAGDL